MRDLPMKGQPADASPKTSLTRWRNLIEIVPDPASDHSRAVALDAAYEQSLENVLHRAVRKHRPPVADAQLLVNRQAREVKALWQLREEPAHDVTKHLFTSFRDEKVIEEAAGRVIRKIGLAPATKIVLENLDWFQDHFDEVYVGDNFKAGETHFGQKVMPMDALLERSGELDAFLLTTNTPEVEELYRKMLPMDKTITISDLSLPIYQRHFRQSGLARATRILEEIEAADKPLVVVGARLLATAEPTFRALETAGYDVFVISLFDKMANRLRATHDETCAVARNALVSTHEMLHILTSLKKGFFWIYYDFFCISSWDASRSLITYGYTAALAKMAACPVVLGMYDVIKPVCLNMDRSPEAFALYKTMFDVVDGVILTSNSDHVAAYLRNTLVKDMPVFSFYRYSFPPKEPLKRLSDEDGERHVVGVTCFLGEVHEPNRLETGHSIRSILGQKIHFHYYSDHPVVHAFGESLPEEEQPYFHIEKAIWDQQELIHEMSRYDCGWGVGDEITVFARLICDVPDLHIRELFSLFIPNSVPTSSMAYGSAGLPVVISRMVKVMDEVFPKDCCIPLDMGEVDNLSNIFAALDWTTIHQTMRDERHRFDVFHQIPRLASYLDNIPEHRTRES